jgi:hypothetical protein
MRISTPTRRLLGPFLLASLLLLPLGAVGADDEAEQEVREAPSIYKWIDENGIAHYTTDRSRIPSGLRRRIEQLDSSPKPLAREEATAAAPEFDEGEATGAAAGATAAAASTRSKRKPRGDSFDAWASRNRPATIERDAWDDGTFSSDPDAPGEAAPPPLTAEEIAALDAEREEIDSRIIELEAEVTVTEDVLKEWVSVSGVNPLEREDDGSFRAAAQLLPQQLAELAALRERLVELETP